MNHQAFLDAIQEQPEDDDLRLVFADWLTDHDECDRADLIRTQVALARLEANDPRFEEFTVRERALLSRHQAAWLGPNWSARLAQVRFQRGFVHEAAIHPRDLDETADDLFRCFPLLRRLRLYPTGGGARELLDFYHEPKGYYAELLRSPSLTRLEGLSLRDNRIGDEAVVALAGNRHAGRLKSLDLSNNPLTEVGVAALVSSPYLASLTELGFAENRLHGLAREALRARFGERVRLVAPWDRRSTYSPHQQRLADWLDQAVILDPERARTREGVIEHLVAELVDAGRLEREALGSVCTAILRREELGSTGIGRGVAMPHAKHESLGRPAGILGLARSGVDFNSLDGEPVYVIVLIVYPGGVCDYTLPDGGLLTRRLRHDLVCRRLRQARSREELLAVLHGPEPEAE